MAKTFPLRIFSRWLKLHGAQVELFMAVSLRASTLATPNNNHHTRHLSVITSQRHFEMTRRTSSKLAQCILDLSWLFYIVVQMCYSISFRTPQMVFLVFRCAPSRRGSTRSNKSGSAPDNARLARCRSWLENVCDFRNAPGRQYFCCVLFHNR